MSSTKEEMDEKLAPSLQGTLDNKLEASNPQLTQTELLKDYFRPLIEYQRGEAYSQGQLCQPLWLFREQILAYKKIHYHINQLGIVNVRRNELHFIAECIQLSHKKNDNLLNFSKLPLSHQRHLLKLAEFQENNSSPYQAYATSLLITFLLREEEPEHRDIAFELLSLGSCNANLFNQSFQLKLSEHRYLLKAVYIEFSGVNLTNKYFKENQINFSGQHLFEANAEKCTLDNIQLRWACLEGVDFNGAEFNSVDADGASFFKAKLFIIARNSHFKYCLFQEAYLERTLAERCDFEEANFKDANLKYIDLIKCDLSRASHLKFHLPTVNSLQGCRVSETLFFKTKEGEEYTKKFNLQIAITQNSDETFTTLFKKMIENEKLECPDGSMNWPNAGWNHDDVWNGKRNITQQVCVLAHQDPLYQVLQNYVHQTSDTMSYASIRFEVARLYKAYTQGDLLNFISKEVTNGPPQHEGRVASITIRQIMAIKNPTLWQQFQESKRQITADLKKQNIVRPISGVKWHLKGNSPFPVLKEEIGECWVFHGTSHEVVKSILQNGFTTRYAQKKPLGVGYGALGKGIYCSDSFPKVATYVVCPICGFNQCSCIEKKEERESWKAIIVARVILGRVYKDNNKNRKDAEGPPPGYHSSWGPNNAFEGASAFDCNEFAVPESQVYPEFCLFYTENKPTICQEVKDKITFLPTINELIEQKNELAKVIEKTLIMSLEKTLQDYYRLIQYGTLEQRFNFLTGPLNVVIDDILVKIPLKVSQSSLQEACDFLRVLEEKRKAEFSFIEKTLSNVSHVQNQVPKSFLFKSSIKVDAYFRNQNWSMAVLTLNKLIKKDGRPNAQVEYYLKRASAYAKSHQWTQTIADISQAMVLNSSLVTEWLMEGYFGLSMDGFLEYSLRGLTSENSHHHLQSYYQKWLEKVAAWLAEKVIHNSISIDAWEYEYWTLLEQPQRDAFYQALAKKATETKNIYIQSRLNYLPNALGVRSETKVRKKQWQQRVKSLTATEKTAVEMAWLEAVVDAGGTSYCLQKGYLTDTWVTQLFDGNGYPRLENRISEGNCLVILLKTQAGERLCYLKFYPEYPLRQQAADEWTYRMSGQGVYTTLVKLTHSKRPDKPYPVLFSEPLGYENTVLPDKTLITLESYYKNNQDKMLEDNLHPYYFTWKFIETYLLQARDEKGDNLVVMALIQDLKNWFYYIAVDNDRMFGHKFSDAPQPNTYSAVFLSNAMEGVCHPTVIKAFRALKIFDLIKDWASQLKKSHQYLIGEDRNKYLFNSAEVKYLKSLQGMQFYKYDKQRYNLACHVDECFSNTDLPNLYERIQYLISKLEAIDEALTEKRRNSTFVDFLASPHQTTHWKVLHLLDEEEHTYCRKAYEKGNTASERFPHLPAITENFLIEKETLPPSNSPTGAIEVSPTVVKISTKSKMPPNPTFIERLVTFNNFIYPFEHYAKMPNQVTDIEGLHHYYSKYRYYSKEIENDRLSEFLKLNLPFLQEKVLNALSWEAISKKTAETLLKHLATQKEFACLKHLRFKACTMLNNSILERILKNNPQLVKLVLHNCAQLTEAITPILARHPNLQVLVLSDLKLKSLNYSLNEAVSFKKLQYLYLWGLKEVETLTGLQFLNLQKLSIKSCHSLVSATLKYPSLKLLALVDLPKLQFITEWAPHKALMVGELLVQCATLTHIQLKTFDLLHTLYLNTPKLKTIRAPNSTLKALYLEPSPRTFIANGLGQLLNDAPILNFIHSPISLSLPESSIFTELIDHHTSRVNALAVLPNGTVVSGSWVDTLKVWDVEQGKCLKTLEGHKNSVLALAVLPNGTVVSGSSDWTLKVWDVEQGKCLKTLEGHKDMVRALAVLPNGTVVSGSRDKTLKVWDVEQEH